MEQRNVTVPGGYLGYPGAVCGPFGCWQSWGWGPAAVGYENIRFRQGTGAVAHGLPAHGAVDQMLGRLLDEIEVNALVHRLLTDLRTHK